MAQIIKHRRGSISGIKNVTTRNAELIVASGSVSDLIGPFVFIGSPDINDEGVAGGVGVRAAPSIPRRGKLIVFC